MLPVINGQVDTAQNGPLPSQNPRSTERVRADFTVDVQAEEGFLPRHDCSSLRV
ncbi:MAG: hypothetical protein HC821_05160 [Lewinella sp.]|nr:hypothetical protein [Lewinella sp.]